MEERPTLEEITDWSYELGQHGFLHPRMISRNEFYRIYYSSVRIVKEFNDECRNLSADDKLTFVCRCTIKLLYSDIPESVKFNFSQALKKPVVSRFSKILELILHFTYQVKPKCGKIGL